MEKLGAFRDQEVKGYAAEEKKERSIPVQKGNVNQNEDQSRVD